MQLIFAEETRQEALIQARRRRKHRQSCPLEIDAGSYTFHYTNLRCDKCKSIISTDDFKINKATLVEG